MNVRLLGLDGVSIRELTDEEIADLMQGMSASKGELFHYSWHNGPRASIDAGRAACDGQVIQYANNPVVCQAVWDGKQNAVLEENWAANKNCWSRGDGATWVRVPNLNMGDGSAKPFYLRGGPESLNGTWVGDAIRNITGEISGAVAHGISTTSNAIAVGALKKGTTYPNTMGGVSGTQGSAIAIDASLIVPTADENRVKTAYGCVTVRLFTEVTNTGAIDAAQLATQLAVVDAELQTLRSTIGSTIIYPNGGTAAAPASIALGSILIENNPFPGVHVSCKAQIFVEGKWVTSPFQSYIVGGVGNSVGVSADQDVSTDKVRVMSGGVFIVVGSNSQSYASPRPAANFTAAPCRVIVTKLGLPL